MSSCCRRSRQAAGKQVAFPALRSRIGGTRSTVRQHSGQQELGARSSPAGKAFPQALGAHVFVRRRVGRGEARRGRITSCSRASDSSLAEPLGGALLQQARHGGTQGRQAGDDWTRHFGPTVRLQLSGTTSESRVGRSSLQHVMKPAVGGQAVLLADISAVRRHAAQDLGAAAAEWVACEDSFWLSQGAVSAGAPFKPTSSGDNKGSRENVLFGAERVSSLC